MLRSNISVRNIVRNYKNSNRRALMLNCYMDDLIGNNDCMSCSLYVESGYSLCNRYWVKGVK